MISQNTIKKHLQDLITSSTFKVYADEAKRDDYTRIKGAPHFSLREANTGKLYSYTVNLSQDFKSLKVVENGIYNHELGFYPLDELKPKRTVKRTVKRATRTTAKKITAKHSTKAAK